MSKCDVWVPPAVFDNERLRSALYSLVYKEFESMWPDECVGGDPTFIYHRGEGLDRLGRVLFFGHGRNDAYLTGYLRGLCRGLLLLDKTRDDADIGAGKSSLTGVIHTKE